MDAQQRDEAGANLGGTTEHATTMTAPGEDTAAAKTALLEANAQQRRSKDGGGDDILELSQAVTLRLGNDALLISEPLGDEDQNKSWRKCGFLLGGSEGGSQQRPKSIDYYNILWAEVSEDGSNLRIDFAAQPHPHSLVASSVEYAIQKDATSADSDADLKPWIERLLSRAYGPATRRKRAWVLVNPHAGPGGADKIWEKQVRPIFEAARMPLTVIRTTYSGEAVGLARDLNVDDFDIAVPCSGDGLPHEVFNGLGQRSDARRALSKLAVCHVPCGSGNAMSCNLYGTHRPSLAALAIVKGVPTSLDLVSVTQGDKRVLSFLSQAVGQMAELDILTEHLRWMGAARFTYGFIKLAFQRKVYPCDIAVKVEIEHKTGIKEHYRRKVEKSSTDLLVDAGGSDATAQETTTATTAPYRDDNEIRGAEEANSSSISSLDSSDDGPGLPPLKYGTIQDKLPEGWELVPHEKLGSFYCGNMAYMAPDANFFSAALANDGLVDLITTNGDVSPFKAIGLQLEVESGRFFDSPLVDYRKVSAFRVVPRHPDPSRFISIDGEAFPFVAFQAEVHHGLGLTLSKRGVFEAPGPKDWDTVTMAERLHA